MGRVVLLSKLEETLVVHGERFEGLAIPFMHGWIDRTLAPAYAAMNVALKRRAEAAAR